MFGTQFASWSSHELFLTEVHVRSVVPDFERLEMNLLVKRFLVLAIPMLILSSSNAGYGIQVENNSGIELEDFTIASEHGEFLFGDVAQHTQTGIGNADLQFGPESPRDLQVAFKPKNGDQIITNEVEIPILGEGESIKLSIRSWLDLIE